MQIAMLTLKFFLPAVGGKARFTRRIFAMAKFFVNSAPVPYIIYITLILQYNDVNFFL